MYLQPAKYFANIFVIKGTFYSLLYKWRACKAVSVPTLNVQSERDLQHCA